MKKIIFAVVGFCVALLPSQILGSLEEFLNKMAEDGKNINGVFYPSENGYLGKGPLSIVYKGKLSPSTEVEIAMKFTHNVFKKYAVQEYEAYTCLHAIDNATVEAYGIPSVSYYGSWKNYTLMAITLLDSHLKETLEVPYLREIDVLAICRQFVRILKYIHSLGILHKNFHVENIMIRNNRVFLIDFSQATRLYMDDPSGSTSGASEARIASTKNDLDVFISHIGETTRNRNFDALSGVISKIHGLNSRYNAVYYDVIHRDFDFQINRIDPNWTGLFSWLTTEQEEMASSESIATIDSISLPSDRVKFCYPEINYNYFVQTGTSGGRN